MGLEVAARMGLEVAARFPSSSKKNLKWVHIGFHCGCAPS
jgi:hypothetical protein